MTAPRTVKPGEAIKAADHNAIVDALVSVVRGSQGIRVTRGRNSVTIGLEGAPLPDGLEARIVEVVTVADPLQRSALNTWYWAVSVGKDDDLALEFPVGTIYNRPNYNGDALIEPASVGDKCWIREVVSPAGEVELELIVRTEVFAVGPACPPEGAAGAGFGVGFARAVELVVGEEGIGHQASGIGAGADGDGASAGLPAHVAAQGPDQPPHGVGEVTSMQERTASIEFLDFADAGEERMIPVPTWATSCSLQLVGLGANGTPPKVELVVGISNTGANAVYKGEASLQLTGELGEANRSAMAGPIDVTARGYVHVKNRALESGTAIGSGMVTAMFA